MAARGAGAAAGNAGRRIHECTVGCRFQPRGRRLSPGPCRDGGGELVRRPVAVLAAVGLSARVAKAATTTIPIVFGTGLDPVEEGLVTSLNRPGGNVTGATFLSALLGAKRLGLLRDLVPGADVIALLVNPNTNVGQAQTKDVQEAARALGQSLVVLHGGSDESIDASFAALTQQHVAALMAIFRYKTGPTDCISGATSSAGNLSASRICIGGGPDELRRQH